MNKTKPYSPEVRERAVRMMFEHEHNHSSQWTAIQSIAQKIGCTAETLSKWARGRCGTIARSTAIGGSGKGRRGDRVPRIEGSCFEIWSAPSLLTGA